MRTTNDQRPTTKDQRPATIVYQPQQSVLNPHEGQRQTACMRYISAPQRSHSVLISPAGGVVRADFSGVMGRAPRRAPGASGGNSGSDMREIMSWAGCGLTAAARAVSLLSS